MLKTLVGSKISQNSSLVQVLLCTFQLLQSDPKVIGNYIEQFLFFYCITVPVRVLTQCSQIIRQIYSEGFKDKQALWVNTGKKKPSTDFLRKRPNWLVKTCKFANLVSLYNSVIWLSAEKMLSYYIKGFIFKWYWRSLICRLWRFSLGDF